MTPEASRELICRLLVEIAPDADIDDVDEGRDLRREVDLDSLDFQTLVERVAEETSVQIPETDYPKVRSLRGMSDYVAAAARA
jgi:acyl carrier protein